MYKCTTGYHNHLLTSIYEVHFLLDRAHGVKREAHILKKCYSPCLLTSYVQDKVKASFPKWRQTRRYLE